MDQDDWQPVGGTIHTSSSPVLLSLHKRKSDSQGLANLSIHCVALAACAGAIEGTIPTDGWSGFGAFVSTLITGVLLTFLFCPLHECLHYTAFKTRRLNDMVGSVIGLLLLLPPHYFRLFHWEHHKYVVENV
jgi:fatty acid desaturase